MKLGLENKKQTTWAAVLGGIAVLAVAYQLVPMLSGTSPQASTSPAPPVSTRAAARGLAHPAKKVRQESLDPTLRLDLLAASERTIYEGSGKNIFVKGQEVSIPTPLASGVTDPKKHEQVQYVVPAVPSAPPIPLKFYGFASQPGDAKKVFLSQDGEVFIAGEGEIVNRRYKVVRISPTAVEMQDMVFRGPVQSIPLTQG